MQFDKDMSSSHRNLFLETRELILSFEEIIETKKERITTYSTTLGGICHMRTMPHGIDIGFLKGVLLADSSNVLRGTGKKLRILPLQKFNAQLVRDFITQAININQNV